MFFAIVENRGIRKPFAEYAVSLRTTDLDLDYRRHAPLSTDEVGDDREINDDIFPQVYLVSITKKLYSGRWWWTHISRNAKRAELASEIVHGFSLIFTVSTEKRKNSPVLNDGQGSGQI